jgi:hypothetical protein
VLHFFGAYTRCKLLVCRPPDWDGAFGVAVTIGTERRRFYISTWQIEGRYTTSQGTSVRKGDTVPSTPFGC